MMAQTLPWIGATVRAATTGIAPGSLCIHLIGFTQTSIPLSSIFGQGQPGCLLLTTPDFAALVLPDASGTARAALGVPPDTALIGAAFFQQTLPFEFDGGGAIVAVRGSNGLAATIGTF
jgi:hypothetical protein